MSPATKNNAYLFTHDPMLTRVYTAAEAIEQFGEDHLSEFGHCVPSELMERYQSVWRELLAVDAELERIRKATEGGR